MTDDEEQDAELIALIIAVQALKQDSLRSPLVLRRCAERVAEVAIASTLTPDQIVVVQRRLRGLADQPD